MHLPPNSNGTYHQVDLFGKTNKQTNIGFSWLNNKKS